MNRGDLALAKVAVCPKTQSVPPVTKSTGPSEMSCTYRGYALFEIVIAVGDVDRVVDVTPASTVAGQSSPVD